MRGRNDATFGSKAFGKSVSSCGELKVVHKLCLRRLLPVEVAIVDSVWSLQLLWFKFVVVSFHAAVIIY